MNQLVTMNRREVLKTTTGLLTGWVVAGSPLALLAPGRAWAVDLTAFTSSEGTTLMSMARTIAPHGAIAKRTSVRPGRRWPSQHRRVITTTFGQPTLQRAARNAQRPSSVLVRCAHELQVVTLPPVQADPWPTMSRSWRMCEPDRLELGYAQTG